MCVGFFFSYLELLNIWLCCILNFVLVITISEICLVYLKHKSLILYVKVAILYVWVRLRKVHILSLLPSGFISVKIVLVLPECDDIRFVMGISLCQELAIILFTVILCESSFHQ